MALTFSVQFVAGMYSGHHEDHVVFPPSPARLVAALLAAAHRSPQVDDARAILSEMCAAADPLIVVPPAYAGGSGETYMQPIAATPGGKKANQTVFAGPQRIMGQRGGKIRKRSSGHFVVTGDLYFVWEHLDLNDEQLMLVQQLASDVGYFGRESDLVVISAGRASKADLIRQCAHSHEFYSPMPRGGKQLRVLSPGFPSWLEDRYASTFGEDARVTIPVDHRVRTASYAPAAVVPNSDSVLFPLAFRRPLPLEQALKYAKSVRGEGGVAAFPLTRSGNRYLDGSAVGLGVVTTGGVVLDPAFDTEVLGENTGAITLQPSYWLRSAQVWMTAVPLIGHPDKWVATQQILAAVPDAEILEMSAAPVRAGQQHVPTSPTQRAWHLILRTPDVVHGPLLLDPKHGTGVCLPDYRAKEAQS